MAWANSNRGHDRKRKGQAEAVGTEQRGSGCGQNQRHHQQEATGNHTGKLSAPARLLLGRRLFKVVQRRSRGDRLQPKHRGRGKHLGKKGSTSAIYHLRTDKPERGARTAPSRGGPAEPPRHRVLGGEGGDRLYSIPSMVFYMQVGGRAPHHLQSTASPSGPDRQQTLGGVGGQVLTTSRDKKNRGKQD